MSFDLKEQYTIQSSLTTEEIIKKLNEIVEPCKILHSYVFSNKSFNGRVKQGSFEMVRALEGANAFAPIITGKIEGQIITVSMRISKVISFFGVFAIGFSLLWQCLAIRQNGFSLSSFFSWFLLGIMYLIARKFFMDEVNKAKAILERTLS